MEDTARMVTIKIIHFLSASPLQNVITKYQNTMFILVEAIVVKQCNHLKSLYLNNVGVIINFSAITEERPALYPYSCRNIKQNNPSSKSGVYLHQILGMQRIKNSWETS